MREFSPDAEAAVPYFIAADAVRMMAGEISQWLEWFGTSRVDVWIDNKLRWLREWERDRAPIDRATLR